MQKGFPDSRTGLAARLSRFALCIAPSSHDAYSALAAIAPVASDLDESALRAAFKTLLQRLGESAGKEWRASGVPPNSLVARFSYLPYHQRAAFALVVIEEFSIAHAAEIMELDPGDVRALLLATRDFLFDRHWTLHGEA